MVTAKKITKDGQPVLAEYAEKDAEGNSIISTYRKIGSREIGYAFSSVEDICNYFLNDANKTYFFQNFTFVYNGTIYRLKNMSLNVKSVQEGWMYTNILLENHEQDEYIFCYSFHYTENSFIITGINLMTGTKFQFTSENMSDIDLMVGAF